MLNNCNVLGSRIAIKLPEKKTQTAGGIVLPGQSAEMPNTGVVLQVGEKVRNACSIACDDVVVWSPYAALLGPLNVDGQEVWFVDESDVLIVRDVKGKETC